jgi:lipopolysaccharide export system permease protein
MLRPLSIIDRYLIKKFLSILLFAVVAMITIFVAVNYVENTDRFIDRKVPSEIIVQYYLNFIPHIVTLTLPVDVLLAALFSVGSLSRFNEITAIKASGISLFRLLMPLILLGMVISLADFWISENIVPAANKTKSDIWKNYVERSGMQRKISGDDINLYDPSGVKVIMDRFDKRIMTVYQMSIQEFRNQALVSRIDAHEAVWDSSKHCWILRNATKRTFAGNAERVENYPSLEKHDLFFEPEDILKGERNPDEMNYLELAAFIGKLKKSGSRTERWEVDYHLKYAYPLTCVIMIFFGAPVAAVRKKGGAGMNIFLTLIICFSYWILIQTGRYMGYNQSLDPVHAAWIANVMFGVIGLYFFARMKS